MASIGSQFAPHVTLEHATSAIASARRATLAERYVTSSLTAEWRWFFELPSIADQWRDLAARALEPNVFYEPAFALAAAAVFGDNVGAVLVWSGTRPRKLLGFFPAQLRERRYGFKLPVLMGWTHPYAPLGTPLVEREAAEPVIAAWLSHLAADQSLPALLLLPLVAADGPFAAALAAIVRRAQMPCAEFGRHRRPLLAPPADRAQYVERALSRHRRKELRRSVRRLTELGALLFTTATEPAGVTAALGDFFALEASGWKGRAGTAAADDDAVRRFIKTALSALSAQRQVAIDRLLLDGRAVAAAITLFSGDAAWYWKTAYDENLARHAPGMLLTAALTEQLADNAAITRTDSVVAPDNTVLDHIWRERLTLSDRLIAVRPAPFAHACLFERLRGTAIAAAKSIRAQLSAKR